jgi:hypothetical protein
VVAPPPHADPTPEIPATHLLEESRLLDEARARLKDQDPAAALALLERAEQSFPGGVLAEERHALRIEVLDAGKDPDRAAREAEHFLREHPASPYVPRIREILARHR